MQVPYTSSEHTLLTPDVEDAILEVDDQSFQEGFERFSELTQRGGQMTKQRVVWVGQGHFGTRCTKLLGYLSEVWGTRHKLRKGRPKHANLALLAHLETKSPTVLNDTRAPSNY